MHNLQGIAASPGVGLGKVHLFVHARIEVSEDPVPVERIEGEVAAFRAGRARAQAELSALVERVSAGKSEDLAGVFEGQIEILMDAELEGQILAAIRADRRSALAAIRDAIEAQRAEFLALEDPYLRARADDLADLGRRLMCATAGVEFTSLCQVPRGAVLIARDLCPSDTAQLDPGDVAAIATESGGRTSHVAIMARTLELPAVVGCPGLIAAVRQGMEIAVDGDRGEVVLEPVEQVASSLTERRSRHLAERAEMLELAPLAAATRDGVRVELAVNIGTPADARAALPWGPDGVGLFRTEFLFMGRASLPSEEEQVQAYAAVARLMKDKPVVIRTLDIGGDKPISAVAFPREENPFLGWRGVRMFLGADGETQDILRTQLRAILRAASEGQIWVMVPMVSACDEVDALQEILEEEKARLLAEGRACRSVKTGIMVETPAAALMADRLAERVDFFSIGANDLTQYTVAADRGNDRVAGCYQPFHPAVWKLVSMVIEAARTRSIPVGMCGELAGVEEAALPLLGLGLNEFSMSAPSLARIKRIIRAASLDEARGAARAVLQARTAAEAQSLARQLTASVLERGGRSR